MTDHLTRSEFEAKSIALFAAARDRADAAQDYRYTGLIIDVGGAFEGRWHAYAYPADKLHQIVSARAYAPAFDFDTFKKGLTRLVREKVLRSRMSNGVRLYEVNF